MIIAILERDASTDGPANILANSTVTQILCIFRNRIRDPRHTTGFLVSDFNSPHLCPNKSRNDILALLFLIRSKFILFYTQSHF